MTHSNRSTTALIAHGFVIRLASGRLWKNFRASDVAIFSTLENAEATMAGFSGRGALTNPKILRVSGGPEEGAIKVDGYWMVEV